MPQLSTTAILLLTLVGVAWGNPHILSTTTTETTNPAFQGLKTVLVEASKDIKKKGDGRKAIEMREDFEKRLSDINMLQFTLNATRTYPPQSTTNANSARSGSTFRQYRRSGRGKLCLVRVPNLDEASSTSA